jgi:hypothetical protein
MALAAGLGLWSSSAQLGWVPPVAAQGKSGGTMVDNGVPGDAWRKSSYSSSGACVEVCRRAGAVLLRDSKDPGGPVLSFEGDTFHDFLAAVKRGEFDRDSPA